MNKKIFPRDLQLADNVRLGDGPYMDAVVTQIKDEIEEKTFSETGMGAMRDAAQGDAPSGGSSSAEASEETEMILKQVVQSGPVVQ